jgi:CHAT domain-containing protein
VGRLIFLGLFFLPYSICAQDYYTDLRNKMLDLYNQKKYSESIILSTQVLAVFPDDLVANLNQSASLFYLNRPLEAEAFIDVALLADPSAPSSLTAKAYVEAYKGNLPRAKQLLIEATKHSMEGDDNKVALAEMGGFGKIFAKQEVFQNLATWFEKTEPSIKQRELSLAKLITIYNKYPQSPEGLMRECREKATLFTQNGKPEMALLAYIYASRWLTGWGYRSEALEMATEGYVQLKSKGCGDNHYLASYVIAQLISYNNDKGDQAKAIQYEDDFKEHIGKSSVITNDVFGLICLAESYGKMRNEKGTVRSEEGTRYAIQAYDMATQHKYMDGVARAANAVAMASIDFYSPESTAIGIKYGELGFRMADKYQLTIKSSIVSNLALLYWSTGRDGQQKGRNLYRFQIEEAKKKSNWSSASLYLNNLGAMYYSQHDLEQAVNLFEESASLSGYAADYSNPEDRLCYYQNQMSANQLLVSCYAQMANAEKTFEAMERSRARVLNERLSHTNIRPPVIADLQNLLKPEEACIMYHVFSGHEIIILVVTKKYAHVFFNSDPRFVGDIREKYSSKSVAEQKQKEIAEQSPRGFEWISQEHQRTQVAQSYDKEGIAPQAEFNRVAKVTRQFSEQPRLDDEMLADLLSRYQRYLITPINNRLSGIKTLIISPNDVLSFIPFETLKTFDGKYLVEKYNIRYVHSTSVWQQLEARKYSDSRKPLLAMGGAIYEDMDEERIQLATAADLSLLQAEVAKNLKEGKSLRRAYASLFDTEALSPLAGTSEEVKNISKNLPGADIFLGKDMTENRLKAMSTSGQLKNYKVLHLATHGFVVAEIPDLSGVAMCILSKEQDGEDGFLNAVEISKLNLNCDLTVLSACQTALGKLYVGEGVTGLTQSILLAGSNAALVSLWPVSDTSTQLFMSNFYKEVAKGKQYSQIVNELKRKFIKGDYGKEFQHPHYWAPFIYYGK